MEMETNDATLEMQADSSKDGVKDSVIKEDIGEESGLGDDINVSCLTDAGGCCSMDVNLESETGNNTNHTASLKSCSSDTLGADNSFSCGSMKKDDSGIYSEKSPLITSPKEISDGEFSESMSESLDDNQCTIDFKHKSPADNSEKESESMKNESANNNVVLDSANDIETVIGEENHETLKAKKESNSDASADSKICDLKKGGKVQGKDKAKSCDANSEKDDKEASQNSSDSDKGSQNEDETWEKFMKNVIKVKSANKRLVDYDESDSDSEQAGSSVNTKGKRCYRKRKPESDDDKDSDDDDSVKHGHSSEDGDGEDSTPVLLRHNQLADSPRDLDDIDSLSDSSNHDEAEIKESSESECDETPMDVSEFGPPKHKWRAMFDLRQRENGYSRLSPSGYFTRKVQGSLQMVQRFELQYKMDHHEGCVNALHFNTTGTLLASGSDDLNIVVWDWIKNQPALVYDSGHRSNVFQSKFMPFSGDCHIVSCARDGQVRLAYLSTTGVCKSTKKIAQHRGAAHKLALENDSPHIFLSCGEDAVTFEIDLREEKPHKLVTTKENDKKVAMYSIHSNPYNSNEFCVGGRDHFIRVYDKRKINENDDDDGVLKRFVPDHIATTEKENLKANVTCACYNHNGTEILGTYNDEDIYLFNNEQSDSANYTHRYRGHRNNQTVKGVNFYGPKSEYIVSGSDCGHIFLWDKRTENIVQHMEGDEGGVINVLEPHPNLPVLATSGLDHDVKIWSPTADEPTDLKGLKKLTKKNHKEREEERSGDGAMIEGSMLWFIMNQLRRGRRRRERAARAARDEPDDDDSDTVSEEELTTSDDSDRDSGQVDRIQCNPS